MASPSLLASKSPQKEYQRFIQGKGKFLDISKIRTSENLPYIVEIRGEVCTNGITVAEFGEGKQKKTCYSIGVDIIQSSKERNMINNLKQLANSEIEKIGADSSEFTFVDPIKDDEKLYLKLKTDVQGKSFMNKSNLSLTPKKYSETMNYEFIEMTGEALIWYNFDEKKYGISFTIKNINFLKDE